MTSVASVRCFPFTRNPRTPAGGVPDRNFAHQNHFPDSPSVTSVTSVRCFPRRILNAEPQTPNALLDRSPMWRRHWHRVEQLQPVPRLSRAESSGRFVQENIQPYHKPRDRITEIKEGSMQIEALDPILMGNRTGSSTAHASACPDSVPTRPGPPSMLKNEIQPFPQFSADFFFPGVIPVLWHTKRTNWADNAQWLPRYADHRTQLHQRGIQQAWTAALNIVRREIPNGSTSSRPVDRLLQIQKTAHGSCDIGINDRSRQVEGKMAIAPAVYLPTPGNLISSSTAEETFRSNRRMIFAHWCKL